MIKKRSLVAIMILHLLLKTSIFISVCFLTISHLFILSSNASPNDNHSVTAEELKQLQEALAEDQDQAQNQGSSNSKNVVSTPSNSTQTQPNNTLTGSTSFISQSPSPSQFQRSSQVSANPDLSVTLDVALSYFSQEDEDVQQFQQLGSHDPNRTGFTLQQLEFHIASNADQLMRMEANLVFSTFGVEIEEAYAKSLALPARLQLRLGQFYAPFGIVNTQHPHAWAFVDQVLVNSKFFGGEGSRGIGSELSWLLPVSWYSKIVLAVQHADDLCCARSFTNRASPPIKTYKDFLYTTHLKQFFSVNRAWGIYWGMSAQLGTHPIGAENRSEVYGSDLHVRWRPFAGLRGRSLTWQTEALHRRRQIPRDVLTDWGGYSQLIWQSSIFWQYGIRHEYIQGIAEDDLDPLWTSARQRSSIQMTWFPSHFSRWRIQGGWVHENMDHPHAWSITLAYEATIGAHGSHAY